MPKITDFVVECLGAEYPDYFQGYGTAFSGFSDSCYGIGDTQTEAIYDCIETLAQQVNLDEETEKRIHAAYGSILNYETAHEIMGLNKDVEDAEYCAPCWHVGIKWNTTEEETQ